jgi:hypothetical protein
MNIRAIGFILELLFYYLLMSDWTEGWHSSRQMHPKFLSFGRVIENNSRIVYIRTHGATQHLERKNLKPKFISISITISAYFYTTIRIQNLVTGQLYKHAESRDVRKLYLQHSNMVHIWSKFLFLSS